MENHGSGGGASGKGASGTAASANTSGRGGAAASGGAQTHHNPPNPFQLYLQLRKQVRPIP